jgi:hypothetical protein
MVELLDDMPAGTLGFRVTGDVTRDDYTGTLEPALERALDAGDGLRTLYVIEDLDRMAPGALWEDSKLGLDLGLKHHHALRRSAIVTDVEWLAQAARLFLWMIPGEARVFPLSELDTARRWIAEG